MRQQIDDRADQAGVTFVEQSIKVAASPSELDHELGIEDAGDGSHLGERHLLQMPTLDERNDALRSARAVSEIDLAPAEPMAQRPKTSAGPDVHGATVSTGAYRPISWQRASCYPTLIG